MTIRSAPAALQTRRRFLEGFLPEDGAPPIWGEVQEGIPVLEAEFWTARQRQAHSLHEVSYRACYKPQLPRHFIERLTEPGELVHDPFGGRGTTGLEAALLGRRVSSNDINPLSGMLLGPRLAPPAPEAVAARLAEIPRDGTPASDPDLSMFYHPDTEAELRALRAWLLEREADGAFDAVDAWIRMVATNRLTGHSAGFFSVYTLPPNQAASPRRQREINRQREQTPPFRDIRALILKKTRQLQKELSPADREALARCAPRLHTGPAAATPGLAEGSVSLTVTSPPFLDVIQYAADNWLRCWFCGLDADAVGRGITQARSLKAWQAAMAPVFTELHRITRPGGHVAFEVGEVKKGSLRLEEAVLPLGLEAGFEAMGVLVNRQSFTKTAHIWGVDNQSRGTNTNRIVLFRK